MNFTFVGKNKKFHMLNLYDIYNITESFKMYFTQGIQVAYTDTSGERETGWEGVGYSSSDVD